jgi:di/tricarboxylate transporter
MSLELITIIVLALMFIIGTARNLNMGVLGLVAAFGVGMLGVGMTLDEIMAGFPVDLFLALMGLTFLFGFAQQNGSIDLLVKWCLRLVRGKVAAAPWIFFALSGVLMSIGAIFAIACVAPLAIPFARRYKINQLMMGMMVVHGGMAGAFSPMSVYGVFVNGFLAKQGLPENPVALFTASFLFNTFIAVVVYLTMGGRKLLGRNVSSENEGGASEGSPRRGSSEAAPKIGGGGAQPSASGVAVLDRTAPAPASPEFDAPEHVRATPYQVLTLAGLAALAIGTAVFGIDIAVLSICIAAVLALVNPKEAKTSLTNCSWSTVILVGGVVTYINVLQTAGTVEFTSAGIATMGLPLIAALLLCYLSGIVSALASSIGTIGVALAIAGPFLATGELNPIGFVAALAISATVVDVSPFSTNGALVLANVDADNRDKFFKQMCVYAGIIIAVAPALAWLAVFLPF